MSITDSFPGMVPGKPLRNFVVAIVGVTVFVIVHLALPLLLLFAIGTNRHGMGDKVANSPFGRLPGLSEPGWKAGGAAFIYMLIVFVAFGAALMAAGFEGFLLR